MTGGLSGIDGHEDDAPSVRAAVQRPSRLLGVAVAPDGRPVGLDLPSLDARGAAEAWRLALGKGPYYVRFEDRALEPGLDRVQRLGRIGEVWLDCRIDGVDGALDLLVAGASRLVLWGDDPELLDAVGDSAVLGWDGARPLGLALADAAHHDVPVLAAAPLPAGEAPAAPAAALYQAPPRPWTGLFEVLHVGAIDDGDEE